MRYYKIKKYPSSIQFQVTWICFCCCCFVFPISILKDSDYSKLIRYEDRNNLRPSLANEFGRSSFLVQN